MLGCRPFPSPPRKHQPGKKIAPAGFSQSGAIHNFFRKYTNHNHEIRWIDHGLAGHGSPLITRHDHTYPMASCEAPASASDERHLPGLPSRTRSTM